MKTMRKAIGGSVAVMALVCLLTVSAQARTYYSFSVGFGGYYPYYGPAYYSGYCYPYAYPRRVYYYARPAYRYNYAPRTYYYSGGYWYGR